MLLTNFYLSFGFKIGVPNMSPMGCTEPWSYRMERKMPGQTFPTAFPRFAELSAWESKRYAKFSMQPREHFQPERRHWLLNSRCLQSVLLKKCCDGAGLKIGLPFEDQNIADRFWRRAVPDHTLSKLEGRSVNLVLFGFSVIPHRVHRSP